MFRSKDLSPIYSKGTGLLKYLRGVPGDEVKVAENEEVLINGEVVSWGLSVAEEKLGMQRSDFFGEAVLGTDEYWFMGTSPLSFDSRYWGSVSSEDVVGRAYPLF